MKEVKVFDIQRASIVDGPGIRTTVFFKGCNLKCKWCHNPESQSFRKQLMVYKHLCTQCGRCKTVCPYHLEKCDCCGTCAEHCLNGARSVCGISYTAEELLKEIRKDRIFYESSNGGVTFSGGECMLQIDALEELLTLCAREGIHTAVDTAGNVPWSDFERILPVTDLFLYDLKCFSDELHRQGTGVSNTLIKENLQKLRELFHGDIIVRIPIIPTFNDSIEELLPLSDFLRSLKITKIELLPYHTMGKTKYEAIGKDFQEYPVPNQEYMQKLRSYFEISDQ